MPGTSPQRRSATTWRQWVTRRSLLLHLAFVIVAGGCLYAGWWQVHRAMQGNTLSYLYSVEWPAFAVVAGIGWWQMFHDTPEDIAERRAFHQRMRQASAEVVARTLPRSARAITVGSHDADGRMLEAGFGGSSTSSTLELGSDAAGSSLLRTGGPPVPTGADDAHLAAALLEQEDEDDPDDELSTYNRYLALLALKGKPKTWRNPHGV